MDKWLNHISEPSIGLKTMKVINDYPWNGTRLELFRGDLRAKSEETRQAVSEPFQNINVQATGRYIWRIKNGAFEHWRRSSYGVFYEKDCFLVLNVLSERQGDRPHWCLHLWVGRWVSQEDYRMGAYKATEMNVLLNNEAIVHIEPQGKESTVFKSYFHFITYYKGSGDEGYWGTRRQQGMHPPRLLKMYKLDPRLDHYRVVEVPTRHNQLNNSFVFVLDRGDHLYQWNGELCKTEDVMQGARYIQSVRASRGMDIKVDTLNDNGDDEGGHPFYMFLSRTSYMTVDDDEEDEQKTLTFPSSKRHSTAGAKGILLRVTTQSDQQNGFKKSKGGVIAMTDLTKESMCILDLGDICFLWYSQRIDVSARSRGLEIITDYLRTTDHAITPAVVLSEGQSSSLLTRAFGK